MRKKSQTEQKGDESRLLTDEEIKTIIIKAECSPGTRLSDIAIRASEYRLIESQRDLTASIKDAEIAELKEQVEYMHDVWEILIEVTETECQERVERIKRELEDITHSPFGINERRWQAVWERELKR